MGFTEWGSIGPVSHSARNVTFRRNYHGVYQGMHGMLARQRAAMLQNPLVNAVAMNSNPKPWWHPQRPAVSGKVLSNLRMEILGHPFMVSFHHYTRRRRMSQLF